jgi:ribosomal protein S18 acetylase RimI-like enzyme
MIQHYLFQTYQKSERFFWSTISPATAHTDDADIYVTGVNNRYLNPAIQKSPLTEDTFQKVLTNYQDFYSSQNLPWVWVIEQHLIPQGLIKKESLEFLDKSSAMYLDLSNPIRVNRTNGFVIEENNDDLTDWGLSLRQAYQDPAETSDAYLDVVNQYIHIKKKQACNTANFHHFVGYLNRIPICCLTLSLQENRARIDDVGTAPKHQNKGFATQMIVYAMQKAFQLGANLCFLEASQAGSGMYGKIGFKKIFSNLYFKINTYP